MHQTNEITELIPHRPPFLWVDRIISCSDYCIITEKRIAPDLDIFSGHYPNNPIMPGVLLCEAIFQSGALLMAKRNAPPSQGTAQMPVLSRIGGAKFKRPVYPGDVVQIKVNLTETLSTAFLFEGLLKVEGKTAVTVTFTCTLVQSSP